MNKLKKFDAAEYLNTPARQAAYLDAAMETGDVAFARDALGIVTRAYGMNKVATIAGLNRVSLYKALGRKGNPEFGTVMGILRALGLTMAVRPAAKRSRAGKHRVTAKALRGLAAKAARSSTRVDA
jgi:probable addiction module antidote protein